jgi:hypothetical protein
LAGFLLKTTPQKAGAGFSAPAMFQTPHKPDKRGFNQ